MEDESQKLNPQDLQTCLDVLHLIQSDRNVLGDLSETDRIALLKAAGRISRPDKLEQIRQFRSRRKVLKVKSRKRDLDLRAATGIRKVREEAVFIAPSKTAEGESPKETHRLDTPIRCYVCKSEFTELHFFYDTMCGSCAELNYSKRFQTADLRGKVALVTGGRVKIGFQAALLLLRSGAEVIVSTRFPHNASRRFAMEKDFGEWKDRVHIYGLDLRHSPSVERFARWVNQHYSHLDILLNNAAQTVRRPSGFYRHLLDEELQETTSLPGDQRALLEPFQQCKATLSASGEKLGGGGKLNSRTWLQAWGGKSPSFGILASAILSQVPYAYDDPKSLEEAFPEGKLDVDLQQVDLRENNSWRLRLSEVPPAEMLEVYLVNAVAPFILCSQLKASMLKGEYEARHIVNVSAMEGKFTRYTKTDKHPHTNMAKAALNMMTATSAPDYAKDRIYMNAVDTGWVTDEDPAVHAHRKKTELGFQPPLDIVDGAARICDPVFSAIKTGEPVWGKFFKDYTTTPW